MELLTVIGAEYRGNYSLYIKFNDGLEGELDLEDHLWGEVFEPLKDKNAFQKFRLNEWTIEWDCGADFAPEALHKMISNSVSQLG